MYCYKSQCKDCALIVRVTRNTCLQSASKRACMNPQYQVHERLKLSLVARDDNIATILYSVDNVVNMIMHKQLISLKVWQKLSIQGVAMTFIIIQYHFTCHNGHYSCMT